MRPGLLRTLPGTLVITAVLAAQWWAIASADALQSGEGQNDDGPSALLWVGAVVTAVIGVSALVAALRMDKNPEPAPEDSADPGQELPG